MMRDVKIHAVLNGFNVEVGCQTMVYTGVDALLIDLGKYLRDPEETEKEVRATALNKFLLGSPVCAAPEPMADQQYAGVDRTAGQECIGANGLGAAARAYEARRGRE